MQYIKPPSHYRILKGLLKAARRYNQAETMTKEDIKRRRIEGLQLHDQLRWQHIDGMSWVDMQRMAEQQRHDRYVRVFGDGPLLMQ